MTLKPVARSQQPVATQWLRRFVQCIFPATSYRLPVCPRAKRLATNSSPLGGLQATGFTLVETLVAISLLTIAIVAPMALTTQSLASAYYAKDQITAFHLAQEAIESVRHARDGNVLKVALGDTGVDLFGTSPNNIPKNVDFTIDTTDEDKMVQCNFGPCGFLQKDINGLYGYKPGGTPTQFIRTVRATPVGSSNDEINVSATVSWQTENYHSPPFTISENLFRWVNDGSGVR